MRGRKPNPQRLRILRGNPGKRPLTSARTSPFVAGTPQKPADLDADASAEWDRLVRLLGGEHGVLCEADYGILLIAATAYSMFKRAERAIAEHGATYETERDGLRMTRPRPEVRIMQQERRAYQAALAELGATPAQHARVSPLPNDSEPKGIAKFFEPQRPRRG